MWMYTLTPSIRLHRIAQGQFLDFVLIVVFHPHWSLSSSITLFFLCLPPTTHSSPSHPSEKKLSLTNSICLNYWRLNARDGDVLKCKKNNLETRVPVCCPARSPFCDSCIKFHSPAERAPLMHLNLFVYERKTHSARSTPQQLTRTSQLHTYIR